MAIAASLLEDGFGDQALIVHGQKELDRFVERAPPEWMAAPLFRECCRSFLALPGAIWNEGPAEVEDGIVVAGGLMISLTAALEGVCTLWPRNGKPRRVSVVDFVTGNHQNVLASGELMRSISLSAHALCKKFAFRRFTLTHLGRSEALVIGTRCPMHGEFLLTITAATVLPVQLRFISTPAVAWTNWKRSTTLCRSVSTSTMCMGRQRTANT